MIVKFTEAYGGRETAMKIYQAGEIVDIPFAQTQDLLKWKIVEEVIQEPPIEEIKLPRRRKAKKEVTDDTNAQ